MGVLGGSTRRDTDGGGGLYLGKVARVAGDTAYVVVARLAPGFEFPARYPASGVDKGDLVVVAFLEGGRDELVILVVTDSAPTPPTQPTSNPNPPNFTVIYETGLAE